MRHLFYILLVILSSPVFAQKPDISILKAIALAESKNFDLALDTLQSAKQQNSPLFLKLKGDCFYGLNRYNEALQEYLNANKSLQDECTFEIAKVYAVLENKELALAWLSKHLMLKNKSTEYTIVTDKAFKNLENTQEWKTLWKRNWYTTAEIEKNAISALLNERNGQTALDELEREQAQLIPRHEYFALQARAYSQLKQWELALNSINLALELHKQNDAYLAIRGNIYFELEEYAKATYDYSKALAQNPFAIKLYLNRAEAARLAGNLIQASEDVSLYQQLYPEATETIYQLGKLEKSRENYGLSIAYFSKLIAHDKAKPAYFIERGLVEMKIQDYQAADEDFGMALDLNPSLKDAYLNKGKIRLYLLDKESACFNFEKAQTLGSEEALKLYTINCLK